ncbi:MAG TPA: maleylpyruvate isomerase family mycothiol-dependent enzyme [Candidatus Binatia bacterium]|nr:maleylpyruvate isomerase family mycothiol-dependent enzyme [Candidatus Binatia bacterium]
MEIAEHIAHLQDNGERLARAALAAGLDAPVPSCPGWDVRALVRHIGGVHRWATLYVAGGRMTPTTAEEDAAIFSAVGDGELLAWFGRGHSGLVTALRESDADLLCWTFLAAPSPLAFWARRQAHETAIHRVDAEIAAGWSVACPPDLAADGIDELLCGFLSRPRGRLVSDPPVTLSVWTDDTDDGWTMSIEPDRRVVSRDVQGDADCRLSGPASDLYLLLWNRQAGDDSVRVEGDRRVLDLWRERAAIR